MRDVPIMIDNGRDSGNFGYQPGVRDLNNVAPRVGFAYNVGGNNDLVIRGGTGLYYNFPVSNVTYRQQFYNNAVAAVFLPTGTELPRRPAARRHAGGLSVRRACRSRRRRRRSSRPTTAIPTAGRARSDSRSSWGR